MESPIKRQFSSSFTSPVKTTRPQTSSPRISSPRAGRCTPKSDRFIPSRSNMDLDISHFHLLKENSTPNSQDTTPAIEEYKQALAETLFEGKMRSPKVLRFKNDTPSKSPRLLNLEESEREVKPQKQRYISETAEKVLDAPEAVNDYYLNLLDWSAKNTVAIALNRAVYLWDANNGTSMEFMKTEGQNEANIVTSISFSKGGDLLAVGIHNSNTHIYDVETKKLLRVFNYHSSRVSALDWNDFLLTSGSRDSLIQVTDVRVAPSSSLVSTLESHTQEVCGLKWSPDGRSLASGGNDNILNIWELGRETPKFSFSHHTAAVKALAWCPFQSNLLASGGGTADRTLRFWNTSSGSCINSIDTKSQVCAIQWSKHYRELVSSHGFSQNQIVVWKYPTMRKLAELRGHTERVLHLSLSPDGKTIASAAGDETLRFWKVWEVEEQKDKKSKGDGLSGLSRGLQLIR